MLLFLTRFHCLFSIFLSVLRAERQFIRPTDICYKVAQQHLEAAEGERIATIPLDNKFLHFASSKMNRMAEQC